MPSASCSGIKQPRSGQGSPWVLQSFCRNMNSQPQQVICRTESSKISIFLHRIIYLGVISLGQQPANRPRTFFSNDNQTVHISFTLPCSERYLQLCDERRCLRYWGFWGAGETLHTALRSASWLQQLRFWKETGTTSSLEKNYNTDHFPLLLEWNQALSVLVGVRASPDRVY